MSLLEHVILSLALTFLVAIGAYEMGTMNGYRQMHDGEVTCVIDEDRHRANILVCKEVPVGN